MHACRSCSIAIYINLEREIKWAHDSENQSPRPARLPRDLTGGGKW